MALGVDSELVGTTLKGGGIWGAIVSVLLATIMAGLVYIRSLHKDAKKVYGYRLAERDTLNAALNESKNAILAQVAATNERNQLTEELARVIAQSNAQAETLNALLKLQFEFIKDDHARLSQIVSALSDSVRNLSTSSNTITAGVNAIPSLIQTLQNHIDVLVTRRGR